MLFPPSKPSHISMRLTALVACMLMLILEACTLTSPSLSAPPGTTELQLSKTPPGFQSPTLSMALTTAQPAQPTLPASALPPTALRIDTPPPAETAWVEPQPSEAQPPTLTPTLACDVDTARLVLSASDENPNIGDTVIVTAKVINEGCVALGLPQYRLYIQSDAPDSIFTPGNLEPVVHYLAVGPGQSDQVEFELTAIASGQAALTATVSYEVHLGYPGPAYWGSTGTGDPMLITVVP